MVRHLLAATLASLLATTSVAWAGSSETLPPDRAQLVADFLASVKPIPATPTEPTRASLKPALDRPMEPTASAPVEVHASLSRLPSAWLGAYYRALAPGPR
jgi:uncharacterized protein YfaQ (DUF2300 family)